jgi:hypothetical protein
MGKRSDRKSINVLFVQFGYFTIDFIIYCLFCGGGEVCTFQTAKKCQHNQNCSAYPSNAFLAALSYYILYIKMVPEWSFICTYKILIFNYLMYIFK